MTYRRSHLAAIALGLLLVVFGHDAVMATNPHAEEHGTHEAPAGHTVDASCGPTQGARSPTDDDLVPDTPPFAPAATIAMPSRALPASAGAWTEPGHPPSVRRALLQVFLN